MGAEEEVLVTLSGGAPWGFRLQGGAEQRKPLQVSKIRRRSQAGRAGLRERDQLVAVNGVSCTSLSHASAMHLIDASGNQLVLTVRRSAEEGPMRSPSPRELQVLSPVSPLSPEPPGAPVSQPLQPGSLRSPPDSEAYYGETDSDIDGPATQEKPRRPRRRGPTRPTPPGAPPDEVYLSDSPAEPAPATPRPSSQGGDSRVSSPSWEEGVALQPPLAEALLLPHGPLRPGPHLIPMVGPVPHPVAEDLTTSYTQKAKQAKLQRAESLQEKSVKEAKTKCRTIASLLTAAPNPHSKGVLMFKKRRQRAKKYTLVSFGAAAGTGTGEEEDGVPPTSESELDDEAFSDARSLTNQSDWDSPYLDMELARVGSSATDSQVPGLTDVSGRGVQLFEQQRQRAASSTQEPAHGGPAALFNGQGLQSPPPPRAQSAPPEAAVPPPSSLPAPISSPSPYPAGGVAPSTPAAGVFNRSARPFTPGFQGQRPGTTSVIFRPLAPKRASESQRGPSPAPPPFVSPPPSFTTTVDPSPAAASVPASGSPSTPRSSGPVTATSSLYIPAPSRPVTPGGAPEPPVPPSAAAMTSTASIFLSAPLRPSARPEAPATGPGTPSSREQRISVPAARTGILQEARRRGTRKQMFRQGKEETKNSPNPELLSLVQNLDEKPRAGGAESGPEDDALSLGAEACNFMQPPGGKSYKTVPAPKTPPPAAPKTPPPVAPKPSARGLLDGLVNGAASSAGISEPPRLQGRGGELFAKRQSRADRYVVEATPAAGFGLGPGPRPRSPSPTPSLPPSWKYSPNIRAPPPIAYNPLLSPFFPQAARTPTSKAQTQGPRATPKQGIKALDFMRHQPYQLKTAMFCFDEVPPTPGTTSGQPKTARVQEIRRFSTPAPQPTAEPLAPTVLPPRAATTLDEPIWRAELAAAPVASPAVPPESPRGLGSSSSSCSFQVARPRFSATRTGLQAHVWRPGAGHQ
ncbi:synaptopodin 2-like protein isoform X1 [Ochotona princeps]|uniref:synaptopodin 2-like protein isoform X1 n=2 Tax=Ochotona princeps TaxID=9978 RepID=UPI002714D623|nr:synaptopodin 2-like protein isoform X1 [Ochotona princeps]